MRRGHGVDASLQRELVQQPAAAPRQEWRGRFPVAHLRVQELGCECVTWVLSAAKSAARSWLPSQRTPKLAGVVTSVGRGADS